MVSVGMNMLIPHQILWGVHVIVINYNRTELYSLVVFSSLQKQAYYFQIYDGISMISV